jgi:hypothetical protein
MGKYRVITPENFKIAQEKFMSAAEEHLALWRRINVHLAHFTHSERCKNDFIAGAAWACEKGNELTSLYNEEEAGELVYNVIGEYAKQADIMIDGQKLDELFKQFKKK